MKNQLVTFVVIIIVVAFIWLFDGLNAPNQSSSPDTNFSAKMTETPKSDTLSTKQAIEQQITRQIKPNGSSKAAAAEPKLALHQHFKQILIEFEQNDYHQILDFHNIVSLCQGIPKTAEQLYQWQVKHNHQPNLDVELMTAQSKACQDVPDHSYEHLAAIYRHGIKNGQPKAKLALANLMPFDSAEKFQLLRDSAAFSTQAIDTLAEKSLAPSTYLNPQQRLFWLSLCTLCPSHGYAGEYSGGDMEMTMMEIKASLDSGQIEMVEQLVAQWHSATVQQRASIIPN